ncbi:MAG: TIR domain-containing protein [Williamsia sp.]|nr:TIR domain-containing protein [Williamsia sp.]
MKKSIKPFVFVSYAHEEPKKKIIIKLIKVILEAKKVDYWLDEKIAAGAIWRDEIDRAIKKADIVFWIVTPLSVHSEYVIYELGFAAGLGKTIIPLIFEEAEIHSRFHVLQALRLDEWSDEVWEKAMTAARKAFDENLLRLKSEQAAQREEKFSCAGYFDLKVELTYTAILDGIKMSKKRVQIMDNWICEEIGSVKEEILKALERNVKFKICLLNVNSVSGYAIARQRSLDLGKELDFVADQVAANLRVLQSITHENFELRLYSTLPTIETYIFDDNYSIGNYLHGKPSKCSTHSLLNSAFKVNRSLDVTGEVEKNFNDVFLKAESASKASEVYVQELHHISLPVRELEKARAFYLEVLELKEIERPQIFDFDGVWFELPSGQQLHLIYNPQGSYRIDVPLRKDGKAPDIHFALRVSHETFHKIMSVVSLKSIEYLLQPFDAKFLQLYVLDPDRHIIEITVL